MPSSRAPPALIQIKARPGGGRRHGAVRHFIFRCPVTGLNVQGTQLEVESEAHYIPQKCLACGGNHFVNPLNGKLMSEEHPPPKPEPV